MKKIRWVVLIAEIVLLVLIWQNKNKIKEIIDPVSRDQIKNTEEVTVNETNQTAVTPTKIIPTATVIPTQKKIAKITPTTDPQPWGISKQIDEVTWTMKVGQDEKMATPQEILTALNAYRQRYGSQILNWDKNLGEYAQSRAKYLNSLKDVDKHEGFNNYVEKEDGFNKLGFTTLGENISYGYKLDGVHVIEWMYAGDEPHNDNQLDNRWNFVGIGVDGLATCLVFGTGKM
jgi:uncharacterized protein YkwD